MEVTSAELLKGEELLPEIQNLFECQLCSDTLSFPVQVKCGHLFCAPCLKKQPMRQSTLTCPICKDKFNRRVQKPREDFQELLSAFNNLLTAFQSWKPETRSVKDNDEGEGTGLLTTREGEDTEDLVRVECSSELNRSTEDNELFIMTQAVTTNIPKGNKVKGVTLQDSKTNKVEDVTRKVPKTNKVKEVTRKVAINANNDKDVAQESESMSIQTVVKNPTAKNISVFPVPVNYEDCPKPLDLTKKLSSQKLGASKRPRYAFPSVDPSLALDLSVTSNRRAKTSKAIGDCRENVNIQYSRRKPILNPVRYYHVYNLPEADFRPRTLENPWSTCTATSLVKPASQKCPPSLPKINTASGSQSSDDDTDVNIRSNCLGNPSKVVEKLNSMKRPPSLSKTNDASGSESSNDDAVANTATFEDSRRNVKVVIERPVSQKLPLSLTNSSNAYGSESSDKILCKALDVLVSGEVDPVNSDNFMPSGDDAILNEAVDAAVVSTASSGRSNSAKRSNDIDENFTTDSSEKRLKMTEHGDKGDPMDVDNEINKNGQDQVNSGDSDNDSEDMFLFQTPTSDKGSPTKTKNSPSAPTKQLTSSSGTLKLSNLGINPKTPTNASLFCTSPPSGALSTSKYNANTDNFDPFADDFDVIPDSEMPKENQSTHQNEDHSVTALQMKTSNRTSETPKKLEIIRGEATTPNSGTRFGKKNSEVSLKDFSTPKQWASPSQQNIKSPSRSFLGRNQKDKYYLAALSPKTPPRQVQSYVFCPTRLSSMQINQLRLLCGMCGGKILREFSDEVTHLILTLEDGRVPQTMKYLFAIAGKKWVLTFDWVEECLKQKKIVREEFHETSNFKGCDIGVRVSRLTNVPLFRGFTFHVLGDFSSSGAKDSDWRRLLKKLGSTIISDVSNVAIGTIVVGDSSDSSVDYQKLFSVRKVVTVAWEWILDCVLNYSVLPISKTEYLVTQIQADELREVGLPPELLPEP
ncbi:unnamed protein product [Allacma fusca]|uniref:RING-type E3 ubiquitin transferase BRCA1 n=1 Tax=Allacma fusca TaxID=39272 RepID=A0A8J2J2M6_9HEXA|nr:unnamed protein product [Allacma fusca]